MRPIFCLLLLIAMRVSADEPRYELISRELEWGRGIRIAEYGGPDLELIMRGREMTHVVAEILDYTRLVPVARANVRGVIVNPVTNTASVIASPDAKMVPMKTTQRVEKMDGVPFPGSNKEMYLLFHEPETGIEVFFLDSIARQNHDNLVIAVPKIAPVPRNNAHRPSEAGADPAVIPELNDWYQRLLEERRALNTASPAAVERFNQHAAEYHSALEKMRAAREALKKAPVGPAR